MPGDTVNDLMNSKPLILHIVTRMAIGGVQTAILALLKNADRTRFDFVVLCTTKEGAWAGRVREMNVPLYSLNRRHRWGLREIWRLSRLIRQINPSLVHIHAAPLVIPVGTAARLAGVPAYIIHHHSVYEKHMAEQSRIARLLELWLTRRADAVIGCSNTVAQFAVDRMGVPKRLVASIPNGIDREEFEAAAIRDPRPDWGLAPETPLVIQVSRYSPQKRIEDFIESAAIVLNRWQGTRSRPVFVVAGSGPKELRAEYERRIKALRLEKSVLLVGGLHDIPSVLPSVQVGVLATNCEGFGLVILEYLAAGLPVVASNLPPIAEIVRDGQEAMLYPPARPDILADQIERLLVDRELAARLTARGRERLAQYKWDTTARRCEEIYDQSVPPIFPGSCGIVEPRRADI